MILVYWLTAIGLTPGGSSTVHIYTQTIHTTQSTHTIHRTELTNWEECGPCPVFASYILVFALQLWGKHGKNFIQGSRRMPVGTMKTIYMEKQCITKRCQNINQSEAGGRVFAEETGNSWVVLLFTVTCTARQEELLGSPSSIRVY